jgi:hypothetical protein
MAQNRNLRPREIAKAYLVAEPPLQLADQDAKFARQGQRARNLGVSFLFQHTHKIYIERKTSKLNYKGRLQNGVIGFSCFGCGLTLGPTLGPSDALRGLRLKPIRFIAPPLKCLD